MLTYSLLLGLGASLGLWQVARAAPEREAECWLDAGLGVLAAMLLGARAGYALQHPALYGANLLAWLQIWQGGLSAWGAIPAGLLAAGIAALILRKPLPVVLDRLAPLCVPLAVLGWLGCSAAGCGYGPALPAGTLGSLPGLDDWGQVQPRFPLQAAAALVLLVYNWGAALALPARSFAGQRAALSGLGLAGVQFAAALVSAEPAPHWNGLIFEAWAALGLGICSAALAVYAFWPRKK